MTATLTVASDTEMGGSAPSFPTTRASFVEGLASPAEHERARAADVLVRTYWKPVYKYVRLRFKKQNEDAKDLTQGFLAHVLSLGWLERFDPRRGSFRSFLRLALDGFVANAEKALGRAKRGGDRQVLALDFAAAESELSGLEPPAPDSVEGWFEAQWRRELFGAAVAELEHSLRARGLDRRAEAFRRYDLAEPAQRPTYAALADALGVDASAVTNDLAAARRELRELVLARLRRETCDEDEFRAELRALLGESWT